MLISPDTARQILADLTESGPVPAAPAGLSRYWFQSNGHVLIGDVAIRGYKHKGQWRLDDRDVRRAGAKLASLKVQLDDTVPLLPRHHSGHSAEGNGWRWEIANWISHAQYVHRHAQHCGCNVLGCPEVPEAEAADGDLPDPLALENLPGGYRLTIASTRPAPLLTWSGQHWQIPRAYAQLLTKAESVQASLNQAASICRECGAEADVQQHRTSSSSGFITRCAACTGSRFQTYTGHLRGVAYSSLSKNTRADAYLCCLCEEPRPAYYFDHCHQHDDIRGPVCASCNTYEGGGFNYLQRKGTVQHLLTCTGCRRERTLPPRHHAEIVLLTFQPEPHKGCATQPTKGYAHTEPDGSLSISIACNHWPGPNMRWVQKVPASEVRSIVRAFVDRALGEQGDES